MALLTYWTYCPDRSPSNLKTRAKIKAKAMNKASMHIRAIMRMVWFMVRRIPPYRDCFVAALLAMTSHGIDADLR